MRPLTESAGLRVGAGTLALLLAGCGGGAQAPATTSTPSGPRASSPSAPPPASEASETPSPSPAESDSPSSEAASPGGAPTGTTELPADADSPAEVPTAADLLTGCTTPTDPGFLTPFVYSAGPRKLRDAADPGWSPARTEREIRKLVRQRQAAMSSSDRKLSRRVFARSAARMDVRLAAAVALLAGYVPRQFFADFDATFSRVEFAKPSVFVEYGDAPEQLAGSFTVLADGEIIALFNERYRHEDPALWSPMMVHEALHHDREPGGLPLEEEAAARLFEQLVFLDMAGDHPEILHERTAMLRGQLTQLLAIVYNSRTVFVGRCANILPGGDVTVSDFYTEGPIPDNYRPKQTPLSPALRTLWRHHDHLGPPPRQHSRAMLQRLRVAELIDTPGDSLDATDLVRVAEAVGFQLPGAGRTVRSPRRAP